MSARAHRSLARAPLELQVEYIRCYFRRRALLDPKEHEIVVAGAEQIFAEIAIALGTDPETIKRRARKGDARLRAAALPELPTAPVVEGFGPQHSFELSQTAVIAEWPEVRATALRLEVLPGVWHAYFGPDSEDERPVVMVHDQHASSLRTMLPEDRLGSVGCDGATIGLVDEAALSDPEFGSAAEIAHRRSAEGQPYARRGFEFSTGGDGHHEVLGARSSGRVCAVAVYVC